MSAPSLTRPASGSETCTIGPTGAPVGAPRAVRRVKAPYRVAAFNRLTDADAAAVIHGCAGVPAWTREIVRRRPYRDLDALIERAERAARRLDREAFDAAFEHRRADAFTAVGACERLRQDRLERRASPPGPDQEARLVAGVIQYEERFGRPFLIRMAGRSTTSVLEHLARRLEHDAAVEQQTVEVELTQLMLLALVRRVL